MFDEPGDDDESHGYGGLPCPPGATQSTPPGQDVNPCQLWLDAWQQMQNQQGAAAQ